MKTTNYWSEPAFYRAHSDLQQNTAKYFLKTKHFKMKSHHRLLDIGCGPGDITKTCSRYTRDKHFNGKIVGIDKSKEMITYAKQQVADDGLLFIRKSVEQLHYFEQFDRIVSFYCLHWVEDKDLAFKNIARSLKEGGEAFLLIPYQSTEIHEAVKKVANAAAWQPYFAAFSDPRRAPLDKEQLRRVIQASGLLCADEELETCFRWYDFKNEAAMLGFLQAWSPYYKWLQKNFPDNESLLLNFGREVIKMHQALIGSFEQPDLLYAISLRLFELRLTKPCRFERATLTSLQQDKVLNKISTQNSFSLTKSKNTFFNTLNSGPPAGNTRQAGQKALEAGENLVLLQLK